MINIRYQSTNLYTQFIVDDTDLDSIKDALSDYYHSGYNIDSDPEARAKFHDVVFPSWVDSSLMWVAEQERILGGLEAENGIHGTFQTSHLNDGTCIAVHLGTTIWKPEEKFYQHRYTALVPNSRGQGLIDEIRMLGLFTVFVTGVTYDEFRFDKPESRPNDWSGAGEEVGRADSNGRGDTVRYIGRVIKRQAFLDAVDSFPGHMYNRFKDDFSVQEIHE